MKLEYKTDNIISAPEHLIIHGCNCQGVMGSGVALAIRNRFPKAYRDYVNLYATQGLYLGFGQFVECKDKLGSKWIFNAFTQEYYGRVPNTQYCDYKAIENCFETVKEFCSAKEFGAFAMPKIGCGLGGGDWQVVLKIIEKVFSDTDLTVVVYDNHAIATQSNRKL
jgi:O-acetyl-ADP-ribose deacetylase (regulator of RNase III)